MRRKTVLWQTSALLFFAFLSGYAFNAHAQPGPSATRRDRFASLLLSGGDPIAERARQRQGEKRPSALVPAPSPFAGSFADTTTSAPVGGSSAGSGSTTPRGGLPFVAATRGSVTSRSPTGMPAFAVAASRRRPAPSRSIKYLRQRAARLERRSHQIVRREDHLRSMHPVNPRQAARIEQILGALARQEHSTLRRLNHIDREVASPTTAVAAVDPLGLRSVAMARHEDRFGPLRRKVSRGLR